MEKMGNLWNVVEGIENNCYRFSDYLCGFYVLGDLNTELYSHCTFKKSLQWDEVIYYFSFINIFLIVFDNPLKQNSKHLESLITVSCIYGAFKNFLDFFEYRF